MVKQERRQFINYKWEPASESGWKHGWIEMAQMLETETKFDSFPCSIVRDLRQLNLSLYLSFSTAELLKYFQYMLKNKHLVQHLEHSKYSIHFSSFIFHEHRCWNWFLHLLSVSK